MRFSSMYEAYMGDTTQYRPHVDVEDKIVHTWPDGWRMVDIMGNKRRIAQEFRKQNHNWEDPGELPMQDTSLVLVLEDGEGESQGLVYFKKNGRDSYVLENVLFTGYNGKGQAFMDTGKYDREKHGHPDPDIQGKLKEFIKSFKADHPDAKFKDDTGSGFRSSGGWRMPEIDGHWLD